jgi:Zn finger protein HypA/HybF involved in hydrogenase expression
MITDGFEYAGDESGEACRMRCKECDFEFTANFNLLTPLNVGYELSNNLTMTLACPSCKASATMDQYDVDLLYLTTVRDALHQDIVVLMADTDVKFIIRDDRYAANFAYFHCLDCGKDFEGRSRTHPDGPLNVKYKPDKDLFKLICPTCGATDEINKKNGPARRQLSILVGALRTVEQQIKELEEEEDG